MAGILAASVRVMDQATAWLATPDRHQQGITHQIDLHATIGIQAALLRRAKEGGSYKVSVSLAQGATWLMSLGLIPKKDLIDFDKKGLEHQPIKPNLISSKTAWGDTTVIGSVVEMSKTPEKWRDPITEPPGASYPEWLTKK